MCAEFSKLAREASAANEDYEQYLLRLTELEVATRSANALKARIKQVEDLLRSEIKTYDDYLTGNVYGYKIKAPDGEELDDACWGFFGDPKESGLLEAAQNVVDYTITHRLKTQGEQQTLALTA
jgi:hypothetical protein